MVIVNLCDNDISDLSVDRSVTPFMYDMLQETTWIAPVRYFFAKSMRDRRVEVFEAVAKNEGLELTDGRFGVKPWIAHIEWPADMQDFLKNKERIPLSDIEALLQLYYYSEPSIILPYTREDDELVADLWQRWENELVQIRDLGRQ